MVAASCMREARQAVLRALRAVDHGVNSLNDESELRLLRELKKATIADVFVDLASQLRRSWVPTPGSPGPDSCALSYDDADDRAKRSIVEAVFDRILLTENEFDEIFPSEPPHR